MSLIQSGSFINGSFQHSGELLAVYNPANNQQVANITQASKQDVEQALLEAKKAFEQWKKLTSHQRAEFLLLWQQAICEHKEELAQLLTQEQGKPIKEARAEIDYAASFLTWFAEEGKRAYGDIIPSHNAQQQLMVTKSPVGVVAAITPWNFPAAMILRKAAAALAAGCTFVVKPDAQTPLTALALAKLAQNIGMPTGAFNVVVNENAPLVGEVFTQNSVVAKLTFTGSTRVGKLLMAQAANDLKRLSLELGGNAPLIVFDDADIETAVAGAITSKYRNAGQTCICTNRILLHAAIADNFIEKYVAAVSQLTVAQGINESSDIGPLINQQAVNCVDGKVQAAVKAGANLLLGGGRHSAGDNFYQPTVLSNVSTEMAIVNEEIFGPVTPILTFETEQQAIELANGTEYGLAAYFYTENNKRVWRVAEQLEYGMVGINDTAISNAYAPFGGVKQSGFGREGSKYGLDDYLSIKYLCMAK